MKKVIIIGSFKKSENGSFGGVYFACNTLTEELLKNNIEVVKLDITLKSINKIGVFNRLPSLIARNVKFFFSILTNYKATTIFVFTSAGNSYLDKITAVICAKLSNKRIVIFPRSGFILTDYKKPLYKRIVDLTFNYADYVVCQSVFWKTFFNSIGVPQSKTIVVENWVDKKKIQNSLPLLFKDTTVEKKQLNIVYLSRIEEAKGVLDIINVSIALKKQNCNLYQFNVYGEGAYLDTFLTLIKENKLEDTIKYMGWLDHSRLFSTINSYDAAIFTSRFEGYPNSLLDYILSKVLVISTSIDTVRAVGGENILYYTPGDIRELQDVLTTSLKNYKQLVQKSIDLYNKAIDINDIDKSLPVILNLIK